MKMGIIGGLIFGGLLGGALISIEAGLIMCGLGITAGIIAVIKERIAEEQAVSWRHNYPSYKY